MHTYTNRPVVALPPLASTHRPVIIFFAVVKCHEIERKREREEREQREKREEREKEEGAKRSRKGEK